MPAPPKFPSAKNIGVTRVLKAGGKHVYRDEDERTDGQVAEIIIIGISVSVSETTSVVPPECVPSAPVRAPCSACGVTMV